MATEPAQPRYIFLYDAYLVVYADSKEEADIELGQLVETIESAGAQVNVFDAWGQEDAETGDTLREVE